MRKEDRKEALLGGYDKHGNKGQWMIWWITGFQD